MSEYSKETIKVERGSPDQCQSIKTSGTAQCENKVVEGSTFCHAHGGNKAIIKRDKIRVHDYLLSRWADRVDDFSDSEHTKTLRGEIGILRMILERKLNSCSTNLDLILQSGPLAELITKIQLLVTACNKQESFLGNMLDRSQIIAMAQEMIAIVSDYVPEEKLNEASEKILAVIDRSSNLGTD